MTWTIWHKSTCSTSRFVLNALRDAGADVTVRDYIADAPTADEVRDTLRVLGLSAGELIRRKEPLFRELGLAGAGDNALIAAMVAHPNLIERPVVLGPKSALCRPKETVFDLLGAHDPAG
ncbi:arsenate reductase family protein [Paracoccus sp. (in: a-proteobacteria)]|uniref:arsenate reductase family protein n=1 Tax=Paracoccus sp. TaxID=267 RepID=UPI0026DFF04D|nr:arsenate reductase family protein [Paracoccus sp. (in: a-proteobacteria)]MDO5647310.1 arsenate reductase family protein [Paracoccus sp. (in: a-proteobacteria)]